MKWSVLTCFLFTINLSFSQTTSIPDSNFEQLLIAMGLDFGSPDGVTQTSAIDTVDYLYLTGYGITDLTGIEDFTALEYLTLQSGIPTKNWTN
jgi:hypothetical protein